MSKKFEVRTLPANAVKLIAMYLKPAARWTTEDQARAAILAADWTGEDHQAFAAFLRERL